MKKTMICVLALLAVFAYYPHFVFAAETPEPEPDLRLVLLGSQRGQIRPCG